jgi:polysaccharide export outer membrane protein
MLFTTHELPMKLRSVLPGKLSLTPLLLVFVPGCAIFNGFLDPTTVGQFPTEYQERGIRRVLTPRDTPPGPPGAQEPQPEDLAPDYSEYRVNVGDQLQIVIDDLLAQGLQEIVAQAINTLGYIRIPRLGPIKVLGMTEVEIEQEIQRRLRESNILPDAVVRTTLQTQNERVYYIIGSVSAAGAYPIRKPDLRILEAIGLAQDIGPIVKELYVIRRTSSDAQLPDEAQPVDDGLVIPPPGDDAWSMNSDGFLLASMQSNPGAGSGDPNATAALEEMLSQTSEQSIVYDPVTGEQVVINRDAASAPANQSSALPPLDEPVGMDADFRWEDVPVYEQAQRVIRIDIDALKSGDPRYNIVIRPGDVINVPVDTGVFYIMGEVNRPGVYALSGREITVKQAISLAAGFSVLAWPSRCEIIRRERGSDRQLTIPVNLDQIFAGLEDDVLLRNDDILNVGTHPIAPFLFVIRNSFRFTYGFGFVYDRNFADIDSFSSKVNPSITEQSQSQLRGLPF